MMLLNIIFGTFSLVAVLILLQNYAAILFKLLVIVGSYVIGFGLLAWDAVRGIDA